MKTAFFRIAALTVSLLALITLVSCSKPVSDAELKQAYLLYIEAPSTLTKIVSTANTDTLIAESLSNDSGSYIRSTEINQADKQTKITTTFKDFHPTNIDSITMNGTVVLTSQQTMFFLNGQLSYKGIKPARFLFKNVQLEQQQSAEGTVFIPFGGSILADRREISSEMMFTEILKE